MEVIRTEGHWVARVSTEEYGVRYFTGIHDETEAWKRGEIYTALADQYDLSDESSRGELPIEVVTDGKEAITAYMYAVHEMSRQEIADTLSVRRDTINQYLSNIRSSQPGRAWYSGDFFS